MHVAGPFSFVYFQVNTHTRTESDRLRARHAHIERAPTHMYLSSTCVDKMTRGKKMHIPRNMCLYVSDKGTGSVMRQALPQKLWFGR